MPPRSSAKLQGMTSPAPTLKPLPPVEPVRPGLWSIPVPLPIPLRYVLVYAFETDRGVYIVDAGWNTEEAFDALDTGLQAAGFSAADVRGVMVTHIHPDHYGLAGRLRDHSDAWIALHPADAALVHDRYEEPGDLLTRMGIMLRRFGAPEEELEALRDASMPARPFVDFATPDVLMEDGDRPDMPGWDLTAVWTPGHSPGHLCFWEPGNKLMLTGDCVLPRITPNINLNAQSGDDPLGDYLTSLERLATFDAEVVQIEDELPTVAPARAAEGHFARETAQTATVGRIVHAARGHQEGKRRRLQPGHRLGEEHEAVGVLMREYFFFHNG